MEMGMQLSSKICLPVGQLMVYTTPDQKAIRLTALLLKEIVPVLGVPEALLSNHGRNLLSCPMQDVCKLSISSQET